MLEEQIRERIFELLEQKDMSLYQLAKLSGIPAQTLYNIKSKRAACPSHDTIHKICEALEITESSFYDFYDQYMYLNDEETMLIEVFRSFDNGQKNRLQGYMTALKTE